MKTKVKITTSSGLDKTIKENIKNRQVAAQVGWFQEDKTRSDGNDNILIVLRHIFGSKTLNIPKRDPIYSPFNRMKKNVQKFFVEMFKTSKGNNKEKMLSATEKTAVYVKDGVIMNEILTEGQGTWEKLSEKTIKHKGNNKMLIDTKEMINKLKFKILNKL
jgi:hypothetical protein